MRRAARARGERAARVHDGARESPQFPQSPHADADAAELHVAAFANAEFHVVVYDNAESEFEPECVFCIGILIIDVVRDTAGSAGGLGAALEPSRHFSS